VQENGPEKIDFKKTLYRQLDELLHPDVIIASSSSGLTMSEIQSACDKHPERCVIAIRSIRRIWSRWSRSSAEQRLRRIRSSASTNFLRRSGSGRCAFQQGMPGHVANRLQAALAREVYYLVAEGVVSAADVDTALCWGPGLRWGIMGSMMLNHLGGGQGGIEHFFQQFTGPMTAWWKCSARRC
jgi:3-hydroxyacyl-CoA dehydrogenase